MKKIDLLSEMKEFKMDPVLEVKEQLAHLSTEEKRAIKEAGFSSNIESIPSVVKDAKGKVYHIDEIKKMCKKYDLKFLHPKYYRGSIHPLLGKNISAYKKENDRGFYSDSFYILAPREMFIREEDNDPILFCYLADNYYEVVDQWGKDLTFKRRLVAIWHMFTMYNQIRTWKGNAGIALSLFTVFMISLLTLILWTSGYISCMKWLHSFLHSLPIAATAILFVLYPIMEYVERGMYFSQTDKQVKDS